MRQTIYVLLIRLREGMHDHKTLATLGDINGRVPLLDVLGTLVWMI